MLTIMSIFNIFFILSSYLWSVSPGGSLEVSHIKIWWFSFFYFTWVKLENTWKSKTTTPFPEKLYITEEPENLIQYSVWVYKKKDMDQVSSSNFQNRPSLIYIILIKFIFKMENQSINWWVIDLRSREKRLCTDLQ